MELNSLIHNLLSSNTNIQEGRLHLKPLDYFLPEGINRKSCIHIAGDEEVGKTSLALELAYKNPDLIFIYIDTYYKLQEKDLPDNVYIFRTNNVEDIIIYLNTLENKAADFIIIDSISNLLLPEDQGSFSHYTTQRYISFTNQVIKIIEKCCNLNICLLLFNTINSNGVPAYFSTQLEFRCSLIMQILSKEKVDNGYNIDIRADKWIYKSFINNVKTILLTGKGGS